MKIVSIDVGIRNLAVCALNTDTKTIDFWRVINLLQDEDDIINGKIALDKCECSNKDGKKCNFSAKFIISSPSSKVQRVCKKHSGDSSGGGGGSGSTQSPRPIAELKQKKVKTLDLQKLCTLMCSTFVEISKKDFNLFGADHIVIELQPKLNPKMKTLSNMIYTCFVIHCSNPSVRILFINAKHKLHSYDGPFIESGHLKGKYEKTKYTGRKQCEHYLNENKTLHTHLVFFQKSKKQDDLADSFLQGVWYSGLKLKIKIF
jgi:hypothetical protein